MVALAKRIIAKWQNKQTVTGIPCYRFLRQIFHVSFSLTPL